MQSFFLLCHQWPGPSQRDSTGSCQKPSATTASKLTLISFVSGQSLAVYQPIHGHSSVCAVVDRAAQRETDATCRVPTACGGFGGVWWRTPQASPPDGLEVNTRHRTERSHSGERVARLHPTRQSSAKAPLAEQTQHRLRQLIGLGENRRAGLLQNLVLGQIGGFCGIVCVLNTAAGGGSILGHILQIADS